MSDTLNALNAANTSSSVLGSIMHPNVLNPAAAITAGNEAAQKIYQTRQLQAQQAWGQALQQATDANGNVDYQKAQSIAAQNPVAAMGMQTALGNNATQRGQQINNAAGIYKTTGIAAMSVARDPSNAGVNSAFDNMIASGLPATEVNAERERVLAMSETDRQNYAYQHGLSVLDTLHQVVGQTTGVNTGGQVQPITITQPGVNSPGGLAVGPGSATTTLTPEGAMGAGIVYPATADDVKAGRASAVGQDVRVSGPDMITRFGLGGMLPAGARAVGGSGGSTGGGVVNSDGSRVGPNNQPKLLNVTPPAQATPPAPPGASSTAPATGGNTGFGAVLARPAAAPAGTTPTAPASPAPPVVSTSPTLRGPGTPVLSSPPAALQPQPGQVWNPNNPVGTSTVPPPAQAPRGGPLGASLQGGSQVASTNALAPNLGAPSAPSPLVTGDVNAIMAGRNLARTTPATGTQTAFNTVATGPGTEDVQGYKTSADKLAADNVAAANFQNTQFPYVQALKNYGEGTTTGPTSDFWNQVAGTIRTPLAKLGMNIGSLDDNTQRQDALGKWLANIQSGNPMSGKSDAELAQVLKGSASTHINETTGADMVKAGLALQRMNVAATREWNSNPALQQQFGTYLNYLGNYNTTTDPRAFAIDTYNPAQIARLRSQLRDGTEADAARFESSLALARRNGMIGGAGSQAMP